jgi:hypothetical protein
MPSSQGRVLPEEANLRGSVPGTAAWSAEPSSVPGTAAWSAEPSSVPGTAAWSAEPSSVPGTAAWSAEPSSVPGTAAWSAEPSAAGIVSRDKAQRRSQIAELIDLVVGDLKP